MKTNILFVTKDGKDASYAWHELYDMTFRVQGVRVYYDTSPGGEDEITFLLEPM